MPSIAAVVASLGRPETVGEVLECLDRQTRQADRVVVSITKPDDLPSPFDHAHVDILTGSKGSCIQRNRAIDLVQGEVDYVVFFDDDYVPSKYALENIVDFFENNPDIVGITGEVFRDGIKGPGIPYEEAVAIVKSRDDNRNGTSIETRDVDGLYGCNMAFRVSAIGNTRFDEDLPLYGWLEDNDFSNRLLPEGRLVYTNAFGGVHCGVKRARSPGVRLGYSQIANPIYLGRKGTVPWPKAINLMCRNMIANHVLSLRPEPWVDRWGRVKGNWLAWRHFLGGKLSPAYIVNI